MKRLTPPPFSSAWIASLALSLSVLSSSLYAAGAKKEKITFEEHIFPLFEDKCMNCHNPDEAKGGLDLSNYGSTMAGGSGGSIAEAGSSGSSRLFTLMAHSEEPYMPPKKPKAPDPEIKLIKKWIDGGLLETSASVAKKSNKPKLDMNLVASTGAKPDGPPPMPQHLLLEPAVVTERPNAVPDMARSPWAPIVAIAGQKQVLLYQSEKAELLGILPYPEGYPQALSFSQNGSLLLCGGGRGGKKGGVVVWDIKNGNRVIEVGREFDIVLGADISPDNRRVALGGPGRNMKIFDTITGEQLFSIKKHSDWLMTLAYSPDGVLLASGGRGGDLFVWEAETAIEFYTLNGHSNAVTSLSWRSDANVLASASEDGTVILWEMGEGKQVKKWNAHSGGVLSVNFAPDGRIVTAGRDKTVKIWKADGKLQKAITASDAIVMSSVFTNDSKRIVSGDWKGNIKIWNATSGKEVASLIANPPSIDGQLHESELAMKKIAGTMPKLQEGVKAATAQTSASAKQLSDAKKAVVEAIARKAEMERQAKAMIAQAAQMAANVKKAQQNLTSAQGESAKLTAELQKVTGTVTAANTELKKWTAESTKRQQVVTTLNASVQKAKALTVQSKVDPKMSKSLADAKAAHASILKAQKSQQNQLAALSKNMQAAEAKMKAAAKPTPPALIKAHQDAVNQFNQTKGQLAATGKRLAEVATQVKPLQASFTAAGAKQKQSTDALAKQVAAQQLATKSLQDAQAKLAAANKKATTLTAQLKSSQQAGANAKAAVKKAQTLLAESSKASDDMKPKMAAAEKAKQQATANADAMEKQRLAREKSYQAVAKKTGAAKKTLEMAKLQLNTNQYLVKKWQAAAVNLKVHKASDKLDDMTEELDDMMEEVVESTEESKKASASLMAVKKTLSEAKLTIEKGRKTLAKKSSAVLETALQLAATKAMVAAATSKKQEPGKIGKQQTNPKKAKDASPDAMKLNLSDLQGRLAKLENLIKGAYADAGKTQKQIDQANAVVAKTPSLISERAKQQSTADAALKKALAEKEAQAAKIVAQQKTIEKLRAKYLKILPKDK